MKRYLMFLRNKYAPTFIQVLQHTRANYSKICYSGSRIAYRLRGGIQMKCLYELFITQKEEISEGSPRSKKIPQNPL